MFCASLDAPSAWRGRYRGMLGVDELARAARFRFERDRRRFITRRGLLRGTLGRYLGAEPGEIRFVTSQHGKPGLAPPWAYSDLRFNLSHSAGLALYAFALGREVGVDIERERSDVVHDQLAERFFSPYERDVITSLPPEDRLGAFFRCWTRKEAFIKAHGEGLSLPLEAFDVSLDKREARLLATRGGLGKPEGWSLQHLAPAPGFAAALAVEGRGWELRRWRLDE